MGFPLISAGVSALGGLLGSRSVSGGNRAIRDAVQSRPTNVTGDFGSINFRGRQATATQDPLSALLQQQLGQQGAGLLGGGLFNNPDLQQALAQNSIAGAQGGQEQLLQQQLGQSAFGGLGNLFGNATALNNQFAQNVAAGPQDLSGGLLGQLFQGGQQNLQQAGNQQALIQQNLDASRALAQPFENQLVNQFANREFMRTRGANTGAERRQGLLQNQLLNADQQRILNAQGLGLQAQQQQGQLGLGQIGAGQGLLGQNLQGFGQQLQGFGQTGQQAQGAEAQQFGQLLQSLQQNQSAGQQRLQNAQNLFGLGTSTRQGEFTQGLQAQQANLSQNQFLSGLITNLLNADANRIGGASGAAQGIAQGGANQANILGGLFGGISDFLS
jgi:hypothetical protein